MRQSAARMRTARQRSERIIDAAAGLFCERGIEDTSIDEIAARAGVGSATVYRYFDTKAELAVRCGRVWWERITVRYLDSLTGPEYERMTGAEQLEYILDLLVRIFEEESGFLKLIQEIEVFVRRYGAASEEPEEYEDCIMSLGPGVTDALEKGRRDGTLSFEEAPGEVCCSVSHTMFSLMKRLAWEDTSRDRETAVSGVDLVRITRRILISGLKSR